AAGRSWLINDGDDLGDAETEQQCDARSICYVQSPDTLRQLANRLALGVGDGRFREQRPSELDRFLFHGFRDPRLPGDPGGGGDDDLAHVRLLSVACRIGRPFSGPLAKPYACLNAISTSPR